MSDGPKFGSPSQASRLFDGLVSIGGAVIADADALIRHADLAMYDAKSQGKNSSCLYHPRGETSVKHNLAMM